MKKKSSYWTVFHKSKSYDIYDVKKFIAQIVKETGSPWCVSYRGFSYRQMEGASEVIAWNAKKCVTFLACRKTSFSLQSIDHSTIGWAMKRLPEGYIHKVITMLHLRIEAKCRSGIYIVDSTGIVTNRYQYASVALKNVQKKIYLKLLVSLRKGNQSHSILQFIHTNSKAFRSLIIEPYFRVKASKDFYMTKGKKYYHICQRQIAFKQKNTIKNKIEFVQRRLSFGQFEKKEI